MNIRGNLRRLYNGVNKHIARKLVPMLCPRVSTGAIITMGRGHGAWRVPAGSVRPDMICYCVGVGVEASFDLELAAAGCQVWSFDPTPTAIDYMEKLDYPKDRLQFLPIGVWSENTTLEFFMPADGIVNLSVKNVHLTGQSVKAPCKTLRTIMAELGHDRIDLLKVDVEGAWKEIIDSMVEEDIRPDLFCVEFDSPTSTAKVVSTVRQLAKIGFVLADIDRDNYLFIQSSLVAR
ncbi:FkbM family methyltransferase [Sphingomonas sp. RS6]